MNATGLPLVKSRSRFLLVCTPIAAAKILLTNAINPGFFGGVCSDNVDYILVV